MRSTMMFTNCYSLTTSPLLHWNRPNSAFLPRRAYSLSIRSSSSDAAATAMVMDDLPAVKVITAEIRTEISRMKESIGTVPGLAAILVGDKAEEYKVPCLYVGIKSVVVRLTEDSSEEEVLKSVSRLNDDPYVHGIIVQSDLPSHIDRQNILNAVSVEKDVEGFNQLNIGQLAMRGREPLFVRPKPKGCIELLHWYKFEIKGKRAVVIGSDNNFGVPVAMLLQREDATVTIIHSETKNPQEITREADIIILGVGIPTMVRGSWIKPGAVVIVAGRSLHFDPGYGCYKEVCKVASAITPISTCSLHLMTLVMLLSNTLTSAKRFHNFM